MSSLSVDQLAILRKNGQYARLYVDFDAPSVVFAAQINETFNTNDLVRDFGFDNVTTGAYTDILPGMTALIGSTPGADDLGRARVRKAATSTRIYIGAASDVAFANNAYVSVIKEFGLWRKSFAYTDGVLYADDDIVYSDQHANFSPVAMAGSHRRVWLRDSTVTVQFDGSDSYCIDSSISGYSWEFPGADSTSGTTTATPSATYDAPGRYLVRLTVTAANGKTHTGTRTLRVFDASDMPAACNVSKMVGSTADGGYSCQVIAYSGVDSVRPGALITVIARDYYDDEETSVGLFPGAENIVIQGWMAEEGIVSNPHRGSVTFRGETANYWLARMEMQVLDLENVSAAATAWTQIQGLTLAKALHHYLFWRTTLMDIVDVHLPLSDTRVIPNIELTGQVAGEQIAEIARRGFIFPLSDPYNRFFCEVDPQYLDETDRDALPVIMEIEKQDRRRGVDFDKRNRAECAQVALSSDTTVGTLYSLSPGRVPGTQGRIVTLDKMAASSQSESNSLAGLHRGRLNNPYPEIPVTMAANNRAISIAPVQYVEISIDAADNPRGEAFSGRAIPREVEYEFLPRTGKMITHLRLEVQSFEDLSVDGNVPEGQDDENGDPGIIYPPYPPNPPEPPTPPLPPPPPLYGDVGTVYMIMNGNVYATTLIDIANPVWYSVTASAKAGTYKQISANRMAGILYAISNQADGSIDISQRAPERMTTLQEWVKTAHLRDEFGIESVPYGIGCNPITGALLIGASHAPIGNLRIFRASYPEGPVLLANTYVAPRVNWSMGKVWLTSGEGGEIVSGGDMLRWSTNDWATVNVSIGPSWWQDRHIRAGISAKVIWESLIQSPSLSIDGGQNHSYIVNSGLVVGWSQDGNTIFNWGNINNEGHGLYRSNDFGTSWTKMSFPSAGPGQSPWDVQKGMLNVRLGIWLAFNRWAIFLSTDNGMTWVKKNGTGLPAYFGDGTIEIDILYKTL